MRLSLACILFCCALFSQGQSLNFKSELGGKAEKKTWVKSQGLEVRIEGDTEKLELLLKNTSENYIVVDADDFTLIHHTGIKDKLCGPALTLGPGQKKHIVLELCDNTSKKGLFGLYRTYESNQSFEESTLFLVDKKFKLQLGNILVDFYTGR